MTQPEPVHLLIAPTQLAWDAVDVFDDLFDELEAAGFDPHVQAPRNGNFSKGGVVIDEAAALSLFVGAAIGAAALDALKESVTTFFSRRFNAALRNVEDDELEDEPEVVRIYGPDSKVLSEVEIPREPPARRRPVERPRRKARRRL